MKNAVDMLPSGWNWKKLKWTSHIIAGIPPHEDTYNTEGIGAILVNGPAEYSEEDFGLTRPLKWTTAQPNGLRRKVCCSVCRGSTTGRLNIAHDRICIGRGVAALVSLGDQSFLNYAMVALRPDVLGTSNGSTFPSVTQDTLGECGIAWPPLQTQQAIAAFLDRKTGQVDEVIQKKQEMIELLQEKRQILINQAVTKGIDPNAPMKDSGIEWVGAIPKHWEVKKLKLLAGFRSGDGITALSIFGEGHYPVYGGNGLRGYTSSFTHSGDFVLIGRQGALCGNINYASGQFWASEHAVVVTPKPNIRVRWFGELLRCMNLGQYSQSAASLDFQ